LLGLHPDVHEAVVVARRGTSDETQLAAYVVCKTNPPTLSELRSHLQRRCPDYMIPASFTFLESFPLTSSGKVDRRALPEPDRTRTNLETRYVPPSTEREQILADILTELLGVDRVGVHDNFFELGGDSILAIQAVSRAGRAGLSITPRQLFQYQTIAELAPVAGLSTSVLAEQGVVEGHVALTPIQKNFFGGDQVDRHHFNQSVLLECEEPLDISALRSALERVLVHHDALRMRFERDDSGWKQWNAGLDAADADSVLSVVNLDSAVTSDLRPQIEQHAAKLQASLNLTDGPLIRAGYFDLGGNRPHRLLLIIHHLVVDGVSWRILLEDLLAAYQSILHGGPVTLPPKTTSFQEWARRMLDHTRSSSDFRSELTHWLADGVRAAPKLPVDHELGENTMGSTVIVTVSLPADETRALLRDVPAAYHTQIGDALVTALTQAVSDWTGERMLLLAMEGHGRESLFDGVDVSRTVGWFTSLFPAQLTLDTDATGEALKSIKEQLRRIPNRGFGYGWLHMTDDAEITRALASLPEPEVTFNYLGQFDNVLPDGVPFRLASESSGPLASPRAKRKQLLDVIGSVTENTMKVHWVFSRNFHRRETIQRLADDFLRRVRAIIAHCQSPEAGGYTASDFPDANLNEEELDNILAELSE
jgi:non-ribosomal peptide synthase protein (TIGR01720 family)